MRIRTAKDKVKIELVELSEAEFEIIRSAVRMAASDEKKSLHEYSICYAAERGNVVALSNEFQKWPLDSIEP